MERSVDAEVLRYSGELTDKLSRLLGERLLGVYLHGSAVLGDYTPARSDVDIVAVSSQPVSDELRSSLRGALAPRALPCQASGLEFSLVAEGSLEVIQPAPPFEVHVSTDSESGTERFVDGHGRSGDPDLVMHYTVLAAHGLALSGPPASKMFPAAPRSLLLDAFRGELDWATRNASPSYQVLNAARVWRFAEENVICSKTAGGEWARERVDDPSVIDAALAHRRGATESHPDQVKVFGLMEDLRARIERACQGHEAAPGRTRLSSR